MRILLVAGSGWRAAAPEVARAAARAWSSAAPRDAVVAQALADGGPGFVEVARPLMAADPGLLVLETALAPEGPAGAGMTDLVAGTSLELGRMLGAALATDARTIALGLGPAPVHGWADGGAGLLVGLSEVLGVPVPGRDRLVAGGAGLGGVRATDLPDVARLRRALGARDVVGAYRSSDPVLGLAGLAAGLAEARRLDPVVAQDLEHNLGDLAHALAALAGLAGRDLLAGSGPAASVRALGALPGAGGGAALVLHALGVRLAPGLRVVADRAGLDAAIDGSDVVVVVVPAVDGGEMHDGTVALVGELALEAAVPVVVVAGHCVAGRREWAAAGISAVYEEPRRSAAASDVLGVVPRVARTWSR